MSQKIEVNVNRRFKVITFDREDIQESLVSFEQLMGLPLQGWEEDNIEHTELMFAMRDVMDDILDLKVWDRMFFKENRDNSNSHSIIIRVD